MKIRTTLFVLLSILTLGACSNKLPDPPTNYYSTTQSSQESPKKYVPNPNALGSINRVYGNLDTADKTETSENIYKDSDKNIYLLLDGTISQVTVDLPLPFDMNLDASHLTDLAKDYMESDVQFIQQNSPTEFVYYSSKIDKKYIVTYSLDNNGNVVVMYVSRDLSDVKLP